MEQGLWPTRVLLLIFVKYSEVGGPESNYFSSVSLMYFYKMPNLSKYIPAVTKWQSIWSSASI